MGANNIHHANITTLASVCVLDWLHGAYFNPDFSATLLMDGSIIYPPEPCNGRHAPCFMVLVLKAIPVCILSRLGVGVFACRAGYMASGISKTILRLGGWGGCLAAQPKLHHIPPLPASAAE